MAQNLISPLLIRLLNNQYHVSDSPAASHSSSNSRQAAADQQHRSLSAPASNSIRVAFATQSTFFIFSFSHCAVQALHQQANWEATLDTPCRTAAAMSGRGHRDRRGRGGGGASQPTAVTPASLLQGELCAPQQALPCCCRWLTATSFLLLLLRRRRDAAAACREAKWSGRSASLSGSHCKFWQARMRTQTVQAPLTNEPLVGPGLCAAFAGQVPGSASSWTWRRACCGCIFWAGEDR